MATERAWPNGRAGPSQGQGCEFESRRPLQLRFMLVAALLIAFQQGSPLVAIPAWEQLQNAYRYSHLDFGKVKEAGDPEPGVVKITFNFPGADGDTVHGVLYEPRTGGHYPCAILLHGLAGNKENMVDRFGKGLLAKGVAYAAIDAPGHGERQSDDDKKVMQAMFGTFVKPAVPGDLLRSLVKADTDEGVEKFLERAVRSGVIDERHLVDYVTSRFEIDHNHVGAVGESMGSIMSTILGGVDNRLSCLCLLVGGDPVLSAVADFRSDLQQQAVYTACSLYAPHFGGPVLMLNGTKDTIIPRDAVDRLYQAFAERNRDITWYDSNHLLPPLATEEAVDWTAKSLGIKD